MPFQPQPSVAVYGDGSWTPYYHTGSSASGSSHGGSSTWSPDNNLDVNVDYTPDPQGARVIFASAGTGTSTYTKSRPRTLASEPASLSNKSRLSRSRSPRRLKLKSTHSHRSHRMVCHDCGTADTPQWRLGINGPGTLCNVCGLLYAKRTQNQISKFH